MSFETNPWQFPSGILQSLQIPQGFVSNGICNFLTGFAMISAAFPKTVEIIANFLQEKPLKSSQISFRKNRFRLLSDGFNDVSLYYQPACRIHFLEWFQEFFLKEICDDFKGLSEGLWQTSFQKLRILGKKKDLRISFRKKQLKFRNRTFTRFKDPTPQGGMKQRLRKRRQNYESQWIVPQGHSQHLQHICLYKSCTRCIQTCRYQIGKNACAYRSHIHVDVFKGYIKIILPYKGPLTGTADTAPVLNQRRSLVNDRVVDSHLYKTHRRSYHLPERSVPLVLTSITVIVRVLSIG